MVKPKKHLGQHFLTDESISERIVNLVSEPNKPIVEIGPGKGVLTKFLIDKYKLLAVDVDKESIEFLKKKYPAYSDRFIYDDFLKLNPAKLFNDKFAVIGNFPYNISSQIFFKILNFKDNIDEVVCMIQKEVAERIVSSDNSKKYGILSVLLQTFYDIELCFNVKPGAFFPPPKVNSAVIKLVRNKRRELPVPENMYFIIVKQSFNKRRKVLSNSLKSILLNLEIESNLLTKRPEQLSVNQFIELSEKIIKAGYNEV